MTQTTTPTLSAPSERLTDGELRALRDLFNEQGYVVIKNVVPRDRLEELTAHVRAEYNRVRSTGALFSGGGQVSGHLNCFPGEESRFVYDALVQRGVIGLVQSLWPTPLRMPNIGCNFNLPGSVIQHYHTDWPFRKEFLIVNVSAVDTDLVNGATEVIPGTHKQYIPYWRFELERLPRYGKRLVSNQGDVLIRTSNLWHRGMPNRSSVPRPMLAFSWEDGGNVHDDPYTLDGGRIQFRPNFFQPSRLGRLRERTFVKAPFTYSAYRIVDSIVTKKGY
jgi:ectoine hydroxylase-related dioxygenase (phytanoyl-CoA dioxygenase family)